MFAVADELPNCLPKLNFTILAVSSSIKRVNGSKGNNKKLVKQKLERIVRQLLKFVHKSWFRHVVFHFYDSCVAMDFHSFENCSMLLYVVCTSICNGYVVLQT